MKVAIFAFGDSITYGRSDLELGGWVNRLWLHLNSEAAKRPDGRVHCYNLGIRGDTTRGMAARLRREVEPRLPPDLENIFILACGTNDAAFMPARDAHVVALDEFTDNLEAAIREAKEFPRAHVLLLTIAPVVEALMGPVNANGSSRFNRYLERYNQIIRELAAAHGAQLVDVYAEFQRENYRNLMPEDGLHPNAEGHARICGLVLKAIQHEVRAEGAE